MLLKTKRLSVVFTLFVITCLHPQQQHDEEVNHAVQVVLHDAKQVLQSHATTTKTLPNARKKVIRSASENHVMPALRLTPPRKNYPDDTISVIRRSSVCITQ